MDFFNEFDLKVSSEENQLWVMYETDYSTTYSCQILKYLVVLISYPFSTMGAPLVGLCFAHVDVVIV